MTMPGRNVLKRVSVLTALIALAGCGSSSKVTTTTTTSTSTSTTTSTTSTTVAAAPALEQLIEDGYGSVRVGMTVDQLRKSTGHNIPDNGQRLAGADNCFSGDVTGLDHV